MDEQALASDLVDRRFGLTSLFVKDVSYDYLRPFASNILASAAPIPRAPPLGYAMKVGELSESHGG